MIILEKEKIRLGELKLAYKARLTSLANNRKIWDHVRDFFPSPYTEKDAIHFIELCNKENPKITFAIEFCSEFVGVIGLVMQSDIYRKSAEIGYWIGEPYWNKGIATEAVKLMVHYGFEKLKLNRIFTGVFEHNKASQRVLEKSGFVHEGIFKNSIVKNNKLINEYRYGIVKHGSLV